MTDFKTWETSALIDKLYMLGFSTQYNDTSEKIDEHKRILEAVKRELSLRLK